MGTALTDPDPGLAIVVGGFINGLGLVRSLAEMGCRIMVITTNAFDLAQHSRYVSEHHHLDALDERPESLASLLEQRAGEWAGALVLPTNDDALASLNQYRERLSQWYRLCIPPLESVPYLIDRTKMLQAAAAIGILLPEKHGLVSELTGMQAQLHYPLVVKPVRSGEFALKFDRKLFLVRNSAEFDGCATQLVQAGVAGQVFDLVPGPDSDIYVYCIYLDQNGQTLAECMVRKLRQSPPGFGSARVAELTENIPLLREQSVELLHRIGFRGFAAIEFKLDRRDGSFRFFEVNGRTVIYNSLLRQGGMDVAKLMVSDFSQGQAKPVQTKHWPGVWINLHADVLRSIQNWRHEELNAGQYLAPYRREKVFAVWSRSDPGPFWAQCSRTFRQACSMVLPGKGRQQ